jgi:hypothetical protein
MQTKVIAWTAGVLMAGTAALGQPTTADKCAASKNQAAGKYGFCRQKAEKKLQLSGDATAYAAALDTCDQKYATKWQEAETRFLGSCPTVGDTTAVQSFVTQHSLSLATALSGAGLPRCGDGSINVAGEQCDGTDLGAASCASLGYPGGTLGCVNCLFDTSACTGPCLAGSQPPPLRTGQTTCYDTSGAPIPCAGSGQDGELQYGATRSFIDNGDGTLTDNTTGLMWEKLADDGSIHDWDTDYFWADASAVKIAALNAATFAGHSDWRLPNVNELQTLVNYGASYPSVYSVANTACAPGCTVTTCSCTQAGAYWASTTSLRDLSYAWFVNYVVGWVDTGDKSLQAYVRAVR